MCSDGGVVCGANRFGVKLWSLEIFMNIWSSIDEVMFDFKPSDAAFAFLPIVGLEGYSVMKLQAKGPHELAKVFPGRRRPRGCGLVAAGPKETLLVAAARKGFRNLALPYLKLL